LKGNYSENTDDEIELEGVALTLDEFNTITNIE
jgi:hypothetical protein